MAEPVPWQTAILLGLGGSVTGVPSGHFSFFGGGGGWCPPSSSPMGTALCQVLWILSAPSFGIDRLEVLVRF